MYFHYTGYFLITLVAAWNLTITALYVWQRRSVPLARTYFWMLVPSIGWMFFWALELVATDLAFKSLWNTLRFAFANFVSFTLLIFTLQFMGQQAWLKPRRLLILASIPLSSLVLTLTNRWHGLIWSAYPLLAADGFLIPLRVGGAWFPIYMTYNYGITILCHILLLYASITFRAPYRSQAIILLVAIVPVSLMDLLWRFIPSLHVTLTPFGYTFFGPIIALALFRYNFLDLVPVAHNLLIKSLPDIVIVLDMKHRVIDINPAAKLILALPTKQVIGRSAFDILPPGPTWADYLAATSTTQMEITYQSSTGEHLYHVQISLLTDHQERITGRVLVLRDMTNHQGIEEALRKFHRAVEQSPASVVITDTAGNIEYVNPKFTQVTGYTATEALGQNPRILKTTMTPLLTHQDMWQTILKGSEWTGEFCNRKKDGSYYWESASISPIFNAEGVITHFVAIKIDITLRKQAEEALKEARDAANAANHEIVLLNQMSTILQRAESVAMAVAQSLPILEDLFAGIAGTLYLVDPTTKRLKQYATWGAIAAPPTEPPVLATTLLTTPSAESEPCTHMQLDTQLCLPLTNRDERLGVLCLTAAAMLDTATRDHWQRLALTVTDQLALAFTNLSLRDRLRKQAIHDSLTGLFNRHYLEEALVRELNRAQRTNQAIGCMLIDIDYFKRYNDTYGHDAGDMVLRLVGDFLRQSIRQEDIACRFGGEEFLLILPGSALQDTQQRAEKLCQAIRQLSVVYQGRTLEQVAVSIGVASFPQHGQTTATMIAAADAALYRAKTGGRNQVVVAPY